MKKLSNKPPKGTSDWFPEEFQIRKYIIDTWRTVCTQFGYEEYLTPIFESADIYRAKSGEDIGGKELMTMEDRAGRELAIRPEMTPSVTRMMTRIYNEVPKPVRYFSIANFVRNEKPQRGRNREFWQLNFDIFGSDALAADLEIVQIALEIMVRFNPPKDSFTMYLNNRKLIDFVLNEVAAIDETQRIGVVRILDKWSKLKEDEFVERLEQLGLNDVQIQNLTLFMQSNDAETLLGNLPELAETEGYKDTMKVFTQLGELGYGDWVRFNPSVIRGFDYYDGMVFEAFDNHPDNNRSMFGGGRYNGLASLFGSQSFPAVGFAPGDETTKLFLESWDLIPNDLKQSVTYIPLIDQALESDIQRLAQRLRLEGENVELGVDEQKVGKALEYADKTGKDKVILFGADEKKKGVYTLKDMKSGEEKEVVL